jgi:hypothetical protein
MLTCGVLWLTCRKFTNNSLAVRRAKDAADKCLDVTVALIRICIRGLHQHGYLRDAAELRAKGLIDLKRCILFSFTLFISLKCCVRILF